jgi:hypothetical protein
VDGVDAKLITTESMETFVCHDLKNQKGEISGGLPAAYRIVPVVFYLAIIGCSTAMGWFELEKRRAIEEAVSAKTQGAGYQAESARLGKERAKIEELNTRATEVSKWVEGSMNLQPVCVAISRAAGRDATIAELGLTRNSEIPSQVHLALTMSMADSKVMDATLQGIRDLGFRAYSAQQSKELDHLDYKATLVWQNTQAVAGR